MTRRLDEVTIRHRRWRPLISRPLIVGRIWRQIELARWWCARLRVHIGATRVIVSQESLLVDLLIVFARNFRLVLLVLTLVESRVAHVRVIGKTHDFRVRHLALRGHHRGWRGVVEVPIELQTVILVHYDASLGALGHPDLLA